VFLFTDKMLFCSSDKVNVQSSFSESKRHQQSVESDAPEPTASSSIGQPLRTVSQFVPVTEDVSGSLQSIGTGAGLMQNGPKRVAMPARVQVSESAKEPSVFPPEKKSFFRVPQQKPPSGAAPASSSSSSKPAAAVSSESAFSEDVKLRDKVGIASKIAPKSSSCSIYSERDEILAAATSARPPAMRTLSSTSTEGEGFAATDAFERPSTADPDGARLPSMSEARSLMADPLWTNRWRF
jgi:hypothetical protein